MIDKKIYFVRGVRGTGKDYAVSRVGDIRKFNFFNLEIINVNTSRVN